MAFDRALFSATIRAKFYQDGLTLREAAKQAGVSASTLSRLVNGEAPDIDSFALVVQWLEMDANPLLSVSPSNSQERWDCLHLCLLKLELPPDLIKAVLTIIQLVKNEVEV